MGEESWLGGFGKGPIAERKLGSTGRSRPRKRVYRHSNARRHEGATKELMRQGRFLHPLDMGPHCPFRNSYELHARGEAGDSHVGKRFGPFEQRCPELVQFFSFFNLKVGIQGGGRIDRLPGPRNLGAEDFSHLD